MTPFEFEYMRKELPSSSLWLNYFPSNGRSHLPILSGERILFQILPRFGLGSDLNSNWIPHRSSSLPLLKVEFASKREGFHLYFSLAEPIPFPSDGTNDPLIHSGEAIILRILLRFGLGVEFEWDSTSLLLASPRLNSNSWITRRFTPFGFPPQE